MAFPFLCPEGHMLQAEESEAGQRMQCPYCGGVFIVPEPPSQTAADPWAPKTPTPPAFVTEAPTNPGGSQAGPETADFPGIQTERQVAPTVGPPEGTSPATVPGVSDLPIVHVLCPNGHTLETPREMLDQEALCPFCQVQFRLRVQDSVEYRRQKAKERELREIRLGQLWLRWAIVAVVVVTLGLVGLFVFLALG